jgi:hypothetical protein
MEKKKKKKQKKKQKKQKKQKKTEPFPLIARHHFQIHVCPTYCPRNRPSRPDMHRTLTKRAEPHRKHSSVTVCSLTNNVSGALQSRSTRALTVGIQLGTRLCTCHHGGDAGSTLTSRESTVVASSTSRGTTCTDLPCAI